MPSQLGQDYYVLELLGGMRNGYFLDSGASDGVTVNNTLLLENEYGWNGICIEPNEAFFTLLTKNRKCHCVNSCLYDYNGVVDFIEASTLGGIVDEYHPTLLNYVVRALKLSQNESGRPEATQKVARTLESIFSEFNAPPIIDYWSLDTEGSELTILKSFPFDKYTFRVLTVEHNHLPVKEGIKIFLEGKGYHRIKEMGIDDCYINNLVELTSAWRSLAWKRSG